MKTYTVRWVKNHLGVTPDMVRRYEDKGIMNKRNYQNSITRHREYSKKDVETLWEVQVYLNMGFSLDEIKIILKEEDIDYEVVLNRKLNELMKRDAETKKHIEFLKTVKMLGRYPVLPEDIEDVRFEDFKQHCLQDWNLKTQEKDFTLYELVEVLLDENNGTIKENQISNFINFFESFTNEEVMACICFHRELVKLKHLEVSHPKVQILSELIFDKSKELFSNVITNGVLTTTVFRDYILPCYKYGQIGQVYDMSFGSEECEFMTGALEYYCNTNPST